MLLHHSPPKAVRVYPTTDEFLRSNNIPNLASQGIITAEAGLPSQYSLRANMSEVENQGIGETCCSFAVTAALEYVNNRADLSEANLADIGGRTYHNCDPKAGLAIGEAMTICHDQGIVLSQYWPYDETKVCWPTPPNITPDQRYKFSQIGVVFNRPTSAIVNNMQNQMKPNFRTASDKMPGNFVALIKSCLVNAKLPVVLDVPVWFKSSHQFDAGWDTGPDIHMPTPTQLKIWLAKCGDLKSENPKDPPGINGWHAIPICGYDDSTGRFLFKNSWAWFWGDQGYGTIPYEYITQYSRTGMVGNG